MDSAQFFLFSIKGIVVGSIYALIALGFNLIYNTTGIMNFTQGEFVMLGGLVAGWAYGVLHLPMAIAVIMSLLCVVFVGVALEIVALRPAKKDSGVSLIIITIGASIVIKGIAALLWGTDPYVFPPFSQGKMIHIAGAFLELHNFYILFVTLVLMIGLAMFLRYTWTGRAMRACAQNRRAARLMGIRVSRMSTLSFALSALMGGIGGIMITPLLSMSFNQGTMLGLSGFCAAILGGISNPVGCVLGGLTIGILEQFGTWIDSSARQLFALGIVVVMLLIRPQGLLGKRR